MTGVAKLSYCGPNVDLKIQLAGRKGILNRAYSVAICCIEAYKNDIVKSINCKTFDDGIHFSKFGTARVQAGSSGKG
jgi:hypothetical protein